MSWIVEGKGMFLPTVVRCYIGHLMVDYFDSYTNYEAVDLS